MLEGFKRFLMETALHHCPAYSRRATYFAAFIIVPAGFIPS
jgi:hypothetical protein